MELDALPDWIADASPLGKVPVMRADGIAIFDSSVIAELIDEVEVPSLHPADIRERARHRSWIVFAAELLSAQVAAYAAASERTHEKKLALMHQYAARLGRRLGSGPWFGGTRFSLVDAAYAPFFVRVAAMQEASSSLGTLSPELQGWSDRLLDRPSVVRSIPPDFAARYADFIRAKGSWLLAGD